MAVRSVVVADIGYLRVLVLPLPPASIVAAPGSYLSLRANDLPFGAIDPLVRAAPLRGLPTLVDELGGDGAALLARFGLPPEGPDGPDGTDAMVPAGTLGRVLDAAAAEVHRPDLGLLLADRQDTGVLGPLAVALENSATFGDALEVASRFLFVAGPVLRVARVPDPEDRPGVVGLRYTTLSATPDSPQAVDLGLGLFHRIITLLRGGPYGLRSVHLPHPPLAPVSAYVEHFGTDVRFDREAALLRVPAQLLSTALPGSNPVLRELALDYLDHHFTDPGHPVADRVRLLLSRSLGTSSVRIGQIARLLAVPQRTLQRRLAAESTTFDEILDEVRRATAHRLITGTDLPLGQVTTLVGFTEQSALTRAVHRWFGCSPRALRRAGAFPTAGDPPAIE
jgi:AraC-like DNA-binding protein